MLSYLLKRLFDSLGVFVRTVRAFFTRKFAGLIASVRRLTNFSRNATKAASSALQGTVAAVKKPSKREDFIETKRLFISKSFLVFLAVGLLALGLFLYYVLWPFLLSHFFVARFFQDDGRIPNWSGRVIVYYDPEKTIPRYSGTLQDGLLEGRGKEYDEAGLLTYEGGFLEGERNGTGSCYEAGVLLYEGQIQNGLYEGTGSLYQEGQLVYEGAFSAGKPNGMGVAYSPSDGSKCYEGAFQAGLYEGEGLEYYPSGQTKYKGSFSNGLYEGLGTAYHPNGERAYVGSFAAGLYEGDGTQYQEDGSLHYKGSFAAGLYEGDGTLTLDEENTIQAKFAGGLTDGTIQWYRNGKIWYAGGAANLTPDGFGSIYAESGAVLYAGEMDRGTINGFWLLTLTAEDVRTAFADASVTETSQDNGFCLTNTELGLSVRCSFQQEGQKANVYRVWLQGGDPALLPWSSRAEAEAWATVNRDPQPEETKSQGSLEQPDGSASGDWWKSQYASESGTCTLLSETETSALAQIFWTTGTELPAAAAIDTAMSQAQDRLEQLTDALASIGGDGSSGASASGNSGASSEMAQSEKDVQRLLGLMLTAENAQELVDALTDAAVYGEMITALESNRPLLEQNKAAAEIALRHGQGSDEQVQQAAARLEELDRVLSQHRAGQEQANLTIENLTKLDPSQYDGKATLLTFDPVKIDLAALYQAALQYAESVAAGRYPVDAEALELDLKKAVLDLNQAYEDVSTARTASERAAANAALQMDAYATGTVEKTTLYDAQCAVGTTTADFCRAIGAFTHQAAHLNTLSGGWISQQYGWISEEWEAVFAGEVANGQAIAEAERQEQERREQEAAEAIRKEQEEAQKAAEEAARQQREQQEAEEAARRAQEEANQEQKAQGASPENPEPTAENGTEKETEQASKPEANPSVPSSPPSNSLEPVGILIERKDSYGRLYRPRGSR